MESNQIYFVCRVALHNKVISGHFMCRAGLHHALIDPIVPTKRKHYCSKEKLTNLPNLTPIKPFKNS